METCSIFLIGVILCCLVLGIVAYETVRRHKIIENSEVLKQELGISTSQVDHIINIETQARKEYEDEKNKLDQDLKDSGSSSIDATSTPSKCDSENMCRNPR